MRFSLKTDSLTTEEEAKYNQIPFDFKRTIDISDMPMLDDGVENNGISNYIEHYLIQRGDFLFEYPQLKKWVDKENFDWDEYYSDPPRKNTKAHRQAHMFCKRRDKEIKIGVDWQAKKRREVIKAWKDGGEAAYMAKVVVPGRSVAEPFLDVWIANKDINLEIYAGLVSQVFRAESIALFKELDKEKAGALLDIIKMCTGMPIDYFLSSCKSFSIELFWKDQIITQCYVSRETSTTTG